MTALLLYEEARRALGEAASIDEVKDVRDKAEAIRLYARQAKDRELQIRVADIRFRAERRIGELKLELRAAGKLHEGGRPKKTSDTVQEVSEKVRLADLDVDDRLSVRCERLASFEPTAFERLMARWRAKQEADAAKPVSINILKEIDDEEARQQRKARVFTGGTVDDLHRLVAEGRTFRAILADPPWHFVSRSDRGDGRSAGQHYKTENLDPLKQLPIAQLAAPDCVLFMWMLDWCPKWALELIEAWGFTHKTTAFTWVKENRRASEGEHPGFFMGQGYWTRANPEDCWLATRGHPKRINADVRQLVVAPVMEHSRKPDLVHDQIERLVDGPYLELFARRERVGWQTWGNEVAFKVLGAAADLPPHDPETGEIIEHPSESIGQAVVTAGTATSTVIADDDASRKRVMADGPGREHPDRAVVEASGCCADPVGVALAARAFDESAAPLSADVGDGGLVAQAAAPASADLDIPTFLRRGHPDCMVPG